MTFRDMFDLTDYISGFYGHTKLYFWALLNLIAWYHKRLSLTFRLKMETEVRLYSFYVDFLHFSAQKVVNDCVIKHYCLKASWRSWSSRRYLAIVKKPLSNAMLRWNRGQNYMIHRRHSRMKRVHLPLWDSLREMRENDTCWAKGKDSKKKCNDSIVHLHLRPSKSSKYFDARNYLMVF